MIAVQTQGLFDYRFKLMPRQSKIVEQPVSVIDLSKQVLQDLLAATDGIDHILSPVL